MVVRPVSCFFQKSCIVAALALMCALTAGNVLAGDAPVKPFAVPCAGGSFAECMKLFTAASGLEVTYAKSLTNLTVSASISAPDPVDGLRRLLDSVGDGNYALAYDAAARQVHISSLGDGGEARTTAAADATPANQPPSKKLFPTDDDIRAANRPPNPDDEVVPGMTNRELNARAEKLDLQRPDLAAPLFPSLYGEKSLTWGQLQERQKQIDQEKPVSYSLPDGSTVSAQKLKEQQAVADSAYKAKFGQTSTPVSDGQSSPDLTSGQATGKK